MERFHERMTMNQEAHKKRCSRKIHLHDLHLFNSFGARNLTYAATMASLCDTDKGTASKS